MTIISRPTARDSDGRRPATRARHIGAFGTLARVLVGTGLVASVVHGHVAGTFRPAPWLLALSGFPALVLLAHGWRARRAPGRFQLTGPLAQVMNIAAFLGLYFTPDYAPAVSPTSDAALLFYGASMLLAALRGYGGCEVLAVSNWLLDRDDQIGCLVFAPVDHLERRHGRRPATDDQTRGWPC